MLRASSSTTTHLNLRLRPAFTACKHANASTANGFFLMQDNIHPHPYCPNVTKYNFPLSTGCSGEHLGAKGTEN
ncbi:hypothetical protein V6Z12_D13G201800 [Gossypium hirsutum]